MKRIVMLMLTTLALGAQLATASVPSKVVSFSDLNLGAVEDVKILYSRLERAAEQVCGTGQGWSVRMIMASRACVSDAVTRAVLELDRPQLTEYYQSRLGAEAPRLAAR